MKRDRSLNDIVSEFNAFEERNDNFKTDLLNQIAIYTTDQEEKGEELPPILALVSAWYMKIEQTRVSDEIDTAHLEKELAILRNRLETYEWASAKTE